ncbi:hypothetical protein Y032_0105g3706 [Ancylostoma ceylanicum]|uniref:Uncharacterized protein n=1 Tax=Ancylostoma ceylanicum TaxID=53326 RepID=A0A016TFJ0_9BILA|nr:hypothetical protein Y032_0105g3706 [Ancylostoma ceylanicum]
MILMLYSITQATTTICSFGGSRRAMLYNMGKRLFRAPKACSTTTRACECSSLWSSAAIFEQPCAFGPTPDGGIMAAPGKPAVNVEETSSSIDNRHHVHCRAGLPAEVLPSMGTRLMDFDEASIDGPNDV